MLRRIMPVTGLSTYKVNAIGWLGLAATVGLAIREYHAIRDCLVLMKRGQELKRALGLGGSSPV